MLHPFFVNVLYNYEVTLVTKTNKTKLQFYISGLKFLYILSMISLFSERDILRKTILFYKKEKNIYKKNLFLSLLAI